MPPAVPDLHSALLVDLRASTAQPLLMSLPEIDRTTHQAFSAEDILSDPIISLASTSGKPLETTPVRADLWQLAMDNLTEHEHVNLNIGIDQDNKKNIVPPDNSVANHKIEVVLRLVKAASKEEENKKWKTVSYNLLELREIDQLTVEEYQ